MPAKEAEKEPESGVKASGKEGLTEDVGRGDEGDDEGAGVGVGEAVSEIPDDRSVRISLWVSSKWQEGLRARAAHFGVPMAELVRDAVEAGVDQVMEKYARAREERRVFEERFARWPQAPGGLPAMEEGEEQ